MHQEGEQKMKACCIPLVTLCMLLLFSILTNRYVQDSCTYWISELEVISTLVDSAQWEYAADHTQSILQDWQHHGSIFHMLLEHQDLDEAENLFYAALASIRTENIAEAQINIYLLISQLRFIASTQEAALENFL